MTLYRATLRQACGGGTVPDAYKWSNIFYINTSSAIFAAEIMSDFWTDTMRPAFSVVNYAYEVYVSDLAPETTNFTTLAIDPGNQRGTYTPAESSNNLYTSAVAYRVDINVPGGYASRKWFRWGLCESVVAPGGHDLNDASWMVAINVMVASLAASTTIRDESGNAFSGYTLRGIHGKRLGKNARNNLPTPPAFG